MKKLALLLLPFGIALLCSPPVFADDSRAQEILKEARAAIGGEEVLQKIQSLNINGQYRRLRDDREFAGDREVSILLPDKYLIEDAFNSGGLSTAMISTRGLNGEHAWSGTNGGGGGRFIMNGQGGQQPTPEQMEAILHRQYQIEFTRYLLAILVMPPPSLAVEYKYVGESDVETAHADVIEVTGPDKFAVRLFFDKQTHMPLLLSYRGKKPRPITNIDLSKDKNMKPEDIKKAKDEAEKKITAAAQSKPEDVDFFIRLTEYKKVGGLLLPHKLTFLTESEVSEEFQVARYQLNPQFKPDTFRKH
jgi:hypothetical protein